MLTPIGSPAPPFSTPLTAAPTVIAFVDRWSPSPRDLDRLRAELRGLGATLFVLSPKRAYAFRADDELEVTREATCDRAFAQDAASWGVERDAIDAGDLALFVVDDHVVRLSNAYFYDGSTAEELLARALGGAGKSLIETPRSFAAATISRRDLVVVSLVAAFALMLGEGCDRKTSDAKPAPSATSLPHDPPPPEVATTITINGENRQLLLDPRTSLLDALRETLGLPGTKKGCDHGQCGACTVLVEGRRVNACLLFAVSLDGANVTTIEGLARGDELHPVQRAFITEDAFQCGYCTPGQILSAVALLREGHAKTNDEVREEMSGNICRCGAYVNIVSAVQRARPEVPA